MQKSMKGKKKKSIYRVVAYLKRDELDFLDDLAKDIHFNYGVHIFRTNLIEEIINAFKDMSQESKEDIEKELIRRFKEEKHKKE